MTGAVEQAERMKVFVSYSRDDVAFADQLVVGLEALGFTPILDRHDIDAAENWKERLGGLILSSDAVAFVLTDKSAGSPICGWEVEEAKRLGKRIVPIVPRQVGHAPPQALAELNWIYFFATPAIPGSGMFDGLRKLDRALRVDLAWLRQQTVLQEQASRWSGREQTVDSPHLLRGAILREAQEWECHAPKDASVSAEVRHFIEASANHEERLKAEAAAGLAEREKALKAAEEANELRAQALTAARAAGEARIKAQRGLRRFSIVALVVGVLLSGAALAGIWYAGVKSVEAGERRAALFALASQELVDKREYGRAAMMALAGDPSAKDGLFESILRPEGYPTLAAALARAHSAEQIVKEVPSGLLHAAVGFPDGKRFALFDNDNNLTVWEIGKDTPVETYKMPGDVQLAAALPDGDHLVLLWWPRGRVTVWSLSQHKDVQVLDLGRTTALAEKGRPGFDAGAVSFAVDPKGKFILTVGMDEFVRLWPIAVGEARTPIAFKTGRFAHVAFNPNDPTQFAAEVSSRGIDVDHSNITAWSIDDPKRPILSMEVQGRVSDIAWPGDHLILGMGDGSLVKTSPIQPSSGFAFTEPLFENYTPIRDAEDGRVQDMRHLELSPNRALLMIQTSRTIRLVRLETGNTIAEFNPGNSEPRAILWPAASSTIVTAPSGMSVRVEDIPAIGQTDNLVETDKDGETTFDPNEVAVGAGAVFAGDWYAGKLQIRIEGKPTQSVVFQGNGDLAVSTDGKTVAALTKDDRVTVRSAEGKLWTTPPNEKWETFSFGPAVAGQSTRIVTANGHGVKIWQAGTNDEIGKVTFPKDYSLPSHIALSPDGQRLLLSFDYQLEFWRVGGGKPDGPSLEAQDNIGAVAFLPDGSGFVVAEGRNLVVRSLDGTLQASLKGHSAAANHLTFSNNGKLMLSADKNGVALLWLINQPNYVQRFDTAKGLIEAIGFDPADRQVVVASDKSMARFGIDPLLLKSSAERVKTACEWTRSLGLEGFGQDDKADFPILEGAKLEPCIARGVLLPLPKKQSDPAGGGPGMSQQSGVSK